MKIAYCGYDFFHACLKYLLEAGHDVHQLYTFPADGQFNFNSYISNYAEHYQIPLTEKAINAQDIQQLEEAGVECLISAGYSYKVPDLSHTRIKGFNIHPTLLPQGRGVWPLPHVILKQLPVSGVTLHKLTQEWDGGDILIQQSLPIHTAENLETLSARTQLLAIALLQKVLPSLDAVWQQATVQQGEVSSWSMPSVMDRYIRWSMTIDEIDRIARAFGKFSALAFFDDALWNIYDLCVWPEQHSYTPGEKVHITNTETIIAAMDGLVCLRYFQRCHDQSILENIE